MFADLDIFKMSSQMASHAGRRQTLAAQNMANVDTPGYRALRMDSFSAVVDSNRGGSSMRATRPGHWDASGMSSMRVATENGSIGISPDGNSVSIESEMLQAIEAKREHDRALAIYKSALNVLHGTLARR